MPTPRKDGKVASYYGRLYPDGTNRLAIEFDNYVYPEPKESGGKGAEFHFRQAFQMVWPKFEMNDWCDLMLWAWCNHKIITVMGHQRASKTYCGAHIVYLDYLASAANTLTSIATVTFEGLKLRMWGDLLRAVETAAIPNPFRIRSTTNECKIYPIEFEHKAGERFQIHGMSVSRTSDAPGRIRGGHADRRRIVLDEAQDMPDAIEDACVNPLSAPDAKLMRLSNPVEKVSKFGDACEPIGGWGSVDESDLTWESKRGGVVLHFDGLQSPNIKAGRTVQPYMLTQESIDMTERKHGRDSVQFWSLVRGWFPPDGMVSKIFPSSVLERAAKPIIFPFPTQACASLDPAFEADNCVLHVGEIGAQVFGAKEMKINGRETLVCKFDAGVGAEPKDYQVAHFVMRECKQRGVDPKYFIMDRTGGGRGVFAILQKEWSRDVVGIDYGGPATDRNLRGDDSRKAKDIYLFFITEAWFRASECCREGMIGGLQNLDPLTRDELSSRRYFLKQGTKGQMMQAETKKDFKGRLGRSPDYADAFVGFSELLMRFGTMPGGGMALKLKTGSMWDNAKQRAIRAASRYNEATEFARF